MNPEGRSNWCCQECNALIYVNTNMVILKKDLWNKVSKENEDVLCDVCIERKLGRNLTEADLNTDALASLAWLHERTENPSLNEDWKQPLAKRIVQANTDIDEALEVFRSEKGEYTVFRRKFLAKLFPKDSEERKILNENNVTSEYMTSHKFAVRAEHISTSYPTKTEAIAAAKKFAGL